MATDYSTTIQKMYIAYFGRPADPVGLEYWTDQITKAGGDPAAVINAFSASAEYKAAYDGKSNEFIVNSIYNNLFGRDAETDGLKYWALKLTNGTFNIGNIAWAIMTGAQNSDATALANKAEAAASFTASLDTSAEILGYSGTAAAAKAKEWLSAVTSDAATLTTAKANVDTAVSTTVSAGASTSGRTFTLTTNIDNLTGTSGNDTFIGDAATASAADQINGGDGTDTLKLYGITTKPVFSGVEQVYLNAPGGNFDVSGSSDVTSIEMDSEIGSRTLTVTSGQAVKLTNVSGGQATTIAGNTPTSLDLTVNKAGTSTADHTVAFTGTALTTLNLTASSNASYLAVTNAGGKLETINITGDKNISLEHALTTVKTINAGSATGNVTIDGVGASDLTFTGGSGNDKIVMGATLTAADTADGGAGTDTLAISNGATLTTAAAVGIKNFEVLEATGGAAGVLDVDTIIAKNTLTGVKVSATTSATINNINDAATGNIVISASNAGGVVFTAKNFVAGGTSDTATIKLDNSVTKSGTGIDVGTGLTFVNLDTLNLVSLGDGTAAKTIASGNGNSIASLTAADLEKITITGDESVTFTTAAATVGLTEVDASGLTGNAAVSVNTSAAANISLLVKGTANADTINTSNAATLLTTIYTGGGNDTVTLNGVATAVNTLMFSTAALGVGELKAGTNLGITLSNGVTGGKVILNFGSAVEALLKSGATVLGTTTANVTIQGTALGANTNVASTVAVSGGSDVTTIQFDLDGDGTYVAANDAQITITVTGVGGGNDTLIYDATNDYFVFTVA